MSLHAIPAGLDVDRLRKKIVSDLRVPSGIVYGNGTSAYPTQLEFTPDLSVPEQSTLADIFTVVKASVDWDASDLSAGVKADVVTLKNYVADSSLTTYLGLASPNLSQTASALKLTISALRAEIRVLNAILRQ